MAGFLLAVCALVIANAAEPGDLPSCVRADVNISGTDHLDGGQFKGQLNPGAADCQVVLYSHTFDDGELAENEPDWPRD